MLTPEEHTKLLRSFEVDRLLKLVTVEAKRLHDGHFAILAFTTGFKVAFGTPDMCPWMTSNAYAQLAEMPTFPTVKEALIAALVSGKTFTDYYHYFPDEWWTARMQEMACPLSVCCGLPQVRSTGEVVCLGDTPCKEVAG